MPDPFAQLLAWRAARERRDVTLLSVGRQWTCRLWDAGRMVAQGQGTTHVVAILNALENYGEPGADAGGAG